jgi:lipoprotein NlpI
LKSATAFAWRAGLIVALTCAAYLPALRGGFVWDDQTLIVQNRLVQAGDGPYRFWFTTEAPDYYPLTWTAWWLQWRWWGERATGYHAVNILLHAVNAILLWAILRRLGVAGAWFAALVFAIHPVNVATAAWISEQKNTLSMLFAALAFLFYLRFDEDHRWRWYGLSLAAFLLALLSKSAVAMLPVALLGWRWGRAGRVRRGDVQRLAPFFALSLVFGLVTVWFQHHRVLEGQQVGPDGFLNRLALAGCVPWFYFYKALWPVGLCAVYPRWGPVAFLPGAVLVAGLSFLAWKARPAFLALGYFVVMLFPVMGFFDQDFYQYSFVADPWQYYSIVGVIALVVAAISRWKHRQMAAVATVFILFAATWERSRLYASEEMLWRDTVKKNPSGWMPRYNLGTALLQAGKPAEAIEQLQQAVRIRPDLVKPRTNLGIALAQAGRLEEAVVELEQALRMDPRLFEVRANLAHALLLLGKLPDAINQWEQALQIKPDSAEVHYDLGVAFERTGRPRQAIEHYQQALRLDPKLIEAQNGLARLRATGDSP